MTPRTLVPLVALLAVGACGSNPQPPAPPTQSPATWTATASLPDGKTGTVTVDATIDSGWHVYSISQPTGGPSPTRVTLVPEQGIAMAGDLQVTPAPRAQFDSAFKMTVETHEHHVRFVLPISVTASANAPTSVRVNARYQVCNASLCLPPQTAHLTAAITRASGS